MTANPQPHPLRCETCEKRYQFCPLDNADIPNHLHEISIKTIMTVGCASHSSAKSSNSKAEPSHARTSDDVLHSDKVMDELFKAVRPEVVFFSLRMEERLRKHDKEKGKHGWNGYSQPEEQDYLFRRLQEEVVELQNDLEGYRKSFEKHHEPSVNSSSETLDVADFAMMIYTAVYGEEVCNRMSKWLFGELRQQEHDKEMTR